MTEWLDLNGYARAAAAWSDDLDPFFRPEYLRAAAIIGHGEPAAYRGDGVLYPFLVRPVNGGGCDLTTPYVMGGPLGSGDWRPGFRAACRERGVVSEFIRFHPLLRNADGLADVRRWKLQDAVTVDVQGDDDALFGQMQGRGRTAVRKAQRSGVEGRAHPDRGRLAEMLGESQRRMDAEPI
ncbi:MAG: hypothetical protein ACTHNU_10870 [Gaiellales bacterium]